MLIKSTDSDYEKNSKGTLFCKASPLEKEHCLKDKKQRKSALKIAIALVNVPEATCRNTIFRRSLKLLNAPRT